MARSELKVKPFRELSVDDLMEAAGLSRTAFYRYFPDREAVLVDLLEELGGALAEARDMESGERDLTGPPSLTALALVLADNRAVLKAIADAAPGDEDLERAYLEFMQAYWIEDLVARIIDAQAEGLAAGLDPHLAGAAFGWMAERMITQTLDSDPRQVLDTIVAILSTCIYRTSPAPAPAGPADTKAAPRRRAAAKPKGAVGAP